jgi:hypothetical protein
MRDRAGERIMGGGKVERHEGQERKKMEGDEGSDEGKGRGENLG